MKVKDLIAYLSELDGDLFVYGMSDDECNATANIYSPSLYYSYEEIPEYGLNVDDIMNLEWIGEYALEDNITVEEFIETNDMKPVVIL